MGGCRAVMLALVLCTALPIATAAASGPQPVYLAENERGDAVVTPDRAAEIVRRQTGGRVLSVERGTNGRPTYRVKVLLDGQRVRYVVVDARSGRVRGGE